MIVLFSLIKVVGQFYMDVRVEYCATKPQVNEISLNNGQLIALTIVLSFTILTLIGTLIDYLITMCPNGDDYKDNFFIEFFQCFSIMKNSSKLFDLSERESNDNRLQFIHGIRVFSILWVILGHCYGSGALMFQPQFPYANFLGNHTILYLIIL